MGSSWPVCHENTCHLEARGQAGYLRVANNRAGVNGSGIADIYWKDFGLLGQRTRVERMRGAGVETLAAIGRCHGRRSFLVCPEQSIVATAPQSDGRPWYQPVCSIPPLNASEVVASVVMLLPHGRGKTGASDSAICTAPVRPA